MQKLLYIRIECTRTKIPKQWRGYCYLPATGSRPNSVYHIMLPRDISLQEQVFYLTHEMIHVQQSVYRHLQLRYFNNDFHVRWRGRDLGAVYTTLPHDERPWERDAMKRTPALALKTLRSIGVPIK